MAVFENRQPVTAAKFINKSSLFILLLGVIRLQKLKPISEQKAENIFVAPPYCQPNVSGSFYSALNVSLSFSSIQLYSISNATFLANSIPCRSLKKPNTMSIPALTPEEV